MPKCHRDYYAVEIPSDCSTDPDERLDLAIIEARERARIYAVPCAWYRVKDDGETIKIARVRPA